MKAFIVAMVLAVLVVAGCSKDSTKVVDLGTVTDTGIVTDVPVVTNVVPAVDTGVGTTDAVVPVVDTGTVTDVPAAQ